MLPIQTLAGRHFSSRAGCRYMWLVLPPRASSAEATTENVARYLGSSGVGASAHCPGGRRRHLPGSSWKKAAHHAGGSTLPDGTRGGARRRRQVVDAVNALHHRRGDDAGSRPAGQARRPVPPSASVDICRWNAILRIISSHAAISVNHRRAPHSDPRGDMDLAGPGSRPAWAPRRRASCSGPRWSGLEEEGAPGGGQLHRQHLPPRRQEEEGPLELELAGRLVMLAAGP